MPRSSTKEEPISKRTRSRDRKAIKDVIGKQAVKRSVSPKFMQKKANKSRSASKKRVVAKKTVSTVLKSCTFDFKSSANKLYIANKNKQLSKSVLFIASANFRTANFLDMYGKGQYLHRITLKKPIYYLSESYWDSPVYIGDTTGKMENLYLPIKNEYSGIGVYHNVTQKNKALLLINGGEIITDNLILDAHGPLVDDEDFPVLEKSDYKLTQKQLSSLKSYILPTDLAAAGRAVLSEFKDNPLFDSNLKTVTLYRGVSCRNKEDFNRFVEKCENSGFYDSATPSSWTSNLCVAQQFASLRPWGIVLTNVFVNEKDVLVDMRLLDKNTLEKISINTNEREIIVRPGKYGCKIYMHYKSTPEDGFTWFEGKDGPQIINKPL